MPAGSVMPPFPLLPVRCQLDRQELPRSILMPLFAHLSHTRIVLQDGRIGMGTLGADTSLLLSIKLVGKTPGQNIEIIHSYVLSITSLLLYKQSKTGHPSRRFYVLALLSGRSF